MSGIRHSLLSTLRQGRLADPPLFDRRLVLLVFRYSMGVGHFKFAGACGRFEGTATLRELPAKGASSASSNRDRAPDCYKSSYGNKMSCA